MLHGLSQLGTAYSPLCQQLVSRVVAAAAPALDHYRSILVLRTTSADEQLAEAPLANGSDRDTQALAVQQSAGVARKVHFRLLPRISLSVTPGTATGWKQDVQQQYHNLAVVMAAAAASTAAASNGSTPHKDFHQTEAFHDDYVNYVGLTGKVVKGPKLTHFQASNKFKAIMVLGLFNRVTGDPFVDAPRPVLVEAWGHLAEMMHRHIQLDDIVYVIGHLALDSRPQARSGVHGPAVTLKADEWSWIDIGSIPADRHTYEYQGEFDFAFHEQRARSATSNAAAGAQQQQQQGRRSRRTEGPAWGPQAVQLLQQGQQPSEIAAELGLSVQTVIDGLITAALAQGWNSNLWPVLREQVGLTTDTGLDPHALFSAVEVAIQNNTAPLTLDGQVRLKAIREHLLENYSGLSEVIRQQEERTGASSMTFQQLKVMVGIKKQGGHPKLIGW